MIIQIEGDTAEEFAASVQEAYDSVKGYKELSMDLESDDWFFESPDGELVQVTWGRPKFLTDPATALALALGLKE